MSAKEGRRPYRGETLSRLRAMICVALLVGLVAVTADVIVGGPLTAVDHNFHRWVLQYGHGSVWQLSYYLQTIGDEHILLPTIGAVSIIAAVRRYSLRPLVITFAVCGALAILVPALKIATGRTAPRSGADLLFSGGAEFPSGHVVNAIVLGGTVLELLIVAFPALAHWARPWLRGLFVIVAGAATGFGVLGLSYHWLTDVLGGWLLGAAMYLIFRGLDPLSSVRHRALHSAVPAMNAMLRTARHRRHRASRAVDPTP